MATQLIAPGSNAAVSADFDVASGDTANVFLKGVESGSGANMVYIEIKDDEGNYTPVGALGYGNFGASIVGPGTFRVRRADGLGRLSCGVSLA